MEIILCGHDRNECALIEEAIYDYYRDKDIPVQIRCSRDWQELSGHIKEKTADAVIVTQEGVAGLDTITNLKLPPDKLIWFSDLDFSLQAYRLCVSYFNRKPLTHEKIIHALKHIE